MNADDNWKETRLLAEDLENLLGVPKNINEDYLKIIENLIIHKFVEQILDDDESINNDYCIELPYLGSLIISINSINQLDINFVPRTAFYKKIRNAYIKKESPLLDQCTKILSNEYVKRFEESDF